jgi:hypothetical protein
VLVGHLLLSVAVEAVMGQDHPPGAARAHGECGGCSNALRLTNEGERATGTCCIACARALVGATDIISIFAIRAAGGPPSASLELVHSRPWSPGAVVGSLAARLVVEHPA